MWPWGHLALGYLLYSLSRRTIFGGRPSGREVVVLAVATQIPDLIDKPLGWTLDVVPSGYGPAHSIFIAVPAGLAVLLLARHYSKLAYGFAYAVGHLSHLVGDVLVAVAVDNTYTISRVLWPAIVLPGSHTSLGTVEQIGYYFTRFLGMLASPEQPMVLVLFFGPLLAALSLWLMDGAPVVRELTDWARQPQ